MVIPSIVLASAQGLDVWTTQRALSSGNGREGNAAMNVGTGGQIAIKAGATVAAIFLAKKIEPRHPKLAKGLLYSLAGVMGSVALHNESIARGR